MRDTTRKRIMEEVQRLHGEVANCAHCEALRQQMARLLELLPPDPVEAGGYTYAFNPPLEYVAIVEARLKELLPDIERELGQL